MECPNGCGDIIRAEELAIHEQRCGFRCIKCGADSKPCQRQLRSWLSSKPNPYYNEGELFS